jgi:hypothetical protein
MYCPTVSSIPHLYFYFNILICIFFNYFDCFTLLFCIHFKLLTCIIPVFSSFRTLLLFLFQCSGLYSPSILIGSILVRCNGGFVFSLYEIQQKLRNCAVNDNIEMWRKVRLGVNSYFSLSEFRKCYNFHNSHKFDAFYWVSPRIGFHYRFLANKEKSKPGVLCCVVLCCVVLCCVVLCCVVWWYFSYQILKQLNIIHEMS